MGARNVVSERGAAAWLSGTHFQIMKLSCELIKEAIHPDNFLPDPIRAFAAAYDLLGIGVTASEAAALVAQGLPWVQRGTNLRHAVRVLRKQGNSAEVVPVGTIALAFKDTWRYGIGIRMGGIPGKVSGLKKSHKAPVTVLPSGNINKAKGAVERFYAHQVLIWLMSLADAHEGLRTI